MDIKDIKVIIDLMTKNGLTEFEHEKDNEKIRIKRGTDEVESGSISPAPAPLLASPAVIVAPPPPAAVVAPATNGSGFKEIKSPMVGTFYRSPSPEAAHYVEIGQAVTEDTVVCIIEAMKVMNEIKAEVKGVITEALAENGKPVEFGKPLFKVKVS